MKQFIALAFLFVLLPSCTLLRSLEATAKAAEDTVVEAKAAVVEAKAAYTEHAAKADTDGDGKTSTSEWLAYLASVIGLGGGAVAEGRRRVGVRNAASDARKSAAEARLDALEAKA